MATVFGMDNSAEAEFMKMILQYHPKYKDRLSDEKERLLEDAKCGYIQTSLLLEEVIAELSKTYRHSPLTNVNHDGMDFDDGSDLKTLSLNYGSNGSRNARPQRGLTGNISSLNTKKGSLRIIIWNSYHNVMGFYYIPKKYWKPMTCVSGSRIRLSSSLKSHEIKKFAGFEVGSIQELAAA